MRYYETLYVVHPDFEEQRLAKLQREVDEWITKKGAKIINSYVWGKRRLAYAIEKHQYGAYILTQFGGEEPFVNELNDWLELHKAVLAYLTVRLDGEPEPRGDGSPRPSKESARRVRTRRDSGESKEQAGDEEKVQT